MQINSNYLVLMIKSLTSTLFGDIYFVKIDRSVQENVYFILNWLKIAVRTLYPFLSLKYYDNLNAVNNP